MINLVLKLDITGRMKFNMSIRAKIHFDQLFLVRVRKSYLESKKKQKIQRGILLVLMIDVTKLISGMLSYHQKVTRIISAKEYFHRMIVIYQ